MARETAAARWARTPLGAAALDQGASVEQVSGVVAARLDEYGGVAVRLRYRLVEADVAALDAPLDVYGHRDTSRTPNEELTPSGHRRSHVHPTQA